MNWASEYLSAGAGKDDLQPSTCLRFAHFALHASDQLLLFLLSSIVQSLALLESAYGTSVRTFVPAREKGKKARRSRVGRGRASRVEGGTKKNNNLEN